MDAGSPKLRPRRQCNFKQAETPIPETTSTKTTRGKLPTTETVKEPITETTSTKTIREKLPTTGIAKKPNPKTTSKAPTSAKTTREKLPTTVTAKKPIPKNKKTEELKPDVDSLPDVLPTTGTGESEPKRVPVYKQIVPVQNFVEDLDNDVYEIRPQDLSPRKKVVRKRQPKRKADPDLNLRKKIKLSPSKKKVIGKKAPNKNAETKKPLKDVSQVLDFEVDDFQPNFNQDENAEEGKTVSQKLTGIKEPNVLARPVNPSVGSLDDNRRKIYSTPNIPRRINSKALEEGRISTPRLPPIDESNKQTDSDEKRKCFGFDDDSEDEDNYDDDVTNLSRKNDVSLSNISPVQRPSSMPRQMFATPQSGNINSPTSSKPQRFNWVLPKPLASQPSIKSLVSVNPITAPLSEVSEQVNKVQIGQLEKNTADVTKSNVVVEPGEKSDEGRNKENSFTSIKSKENDENSFPSTTVDSNVESTEAEKKTIEKPPTKITKQEKATKKSTQPLISGFLMKETGKKRESKKSVSESEKAFTTEQKSPDICRGQKKQRPSKTYERRSLIQSTTEGPNSSENDTDPEDPETSHWQQLQTSHFSEIEEMSLEFK